MNTGLNPADDASRGLTAEQMTEEARWLKGPEFLWGENSSWLKEARILSGTSDDDPEVKKEVQSHLITHQMQEPLELMIQRYPTWKKTEERHRLADEIQTVHQKEISPSIKKWKCL